MKPITTTLAFALLYAAHAIYNHGPAERYWDMLKELKGDQLAQLQKIVFNPDLTKRATLEQVTAWAEEQGPKVQKLLNKSLTFYERRDELRNLNLDQREANFSVAGRELDAEIRAIYDNMDLTDRQTCESVAEAISLSADELQKELDVQPMNCDAIFSKLHPS